VTRPPTARSRLEQQARIAWRRWGSAYAGYRRCDGCGQLAYCRRPSRGRWLCLGCWDAR
jgi:hypothetical protein